jgi:hypothetical protein
VHTALLLLSGATNAEEGMQIRGINPEKKGHSLEKLESSEHKASHAGHKIQEEGKAPVLLPTADRVSISEGLREHTKSIQDLTSRAKAVGGEVDPKHQAKLDSLREKIEAGTLITQDVLKQTAQKVLGDL